MSKKKFVQINGVLRAPAYIGNVYYMGGEKISMEVLVSDKNNFAPEVVELSEESQELIDKTMKELASKEAPKTAAEKAAEKKAAAEAAKAAEEAKKAAGGEAPLV